MATVTSFTVLLLLMPLFSCSPAVPKNPKLGGVRRRGRCNNHEEVEAQIRSLSEGQEEVRGEMATLHASVRALHASLNALNALAEEALPEDCTAAHVRGSWSPVVKIKPPNLPAREVKCEHNIDGGGWTVVLSRFPHAPSTPTPHPHDRPAYPHTSRTSPARPRSAHVHPHARISFNRTWEEYKNGFGELNGEFWIGNEVLHALTSRLPHQLRIELGDRDGNILTATWDEFSVGSEREHYRLNIGSYRADSTAENDLQYHDQKPFSTHDRENDPYQHDHCAQVHGGGWWYNSCYLAHLTGAAQEAGSVSKQGMIWHSWHGYHALNTATMMIRPPPLP